MTKFAVVFVYVVMMWSSSPSFAQNGNAVLAKCADEGTTYDKTKCRDANLGKTFNFKGRVFDVKDAKTLTIQISNGNYADVVFLSNVGDTAKVDQVLSFHGLLARIGTGIVVHHNISDAILGEARPQAKAQGNIAKENTKNAKECRALYQTWVFNEIVEEFCKFNGGLAEKALLMTKQFCPNISGEQQTEWGKTVAAALKKDYDQFGLDGQCDRYKLEYNAVAERINN